MDITFDMLNFRPAASRQPSAAKAGKGARGSTASFFSLKEGEGTIWSDGANRIVMPVLDTGIHALGAAPEDGRVKPRP